MVTSRPNLMNQGTTIILSIIYTHQLTQSKSVHNRSESNDSNMKEEVP